MTYEEARSLVLSFPGVEEAKSYGTPGFRVKTKFFTRLHQAGDSLVIHVGSIDERDMLLEKDPKVFHITDHYRDHPIVLARFARIREDTLRMLLDRRWREIAPKTKPRRSDR
jgi:hypothetical protein